MDSEVAYIRRFTPEKAAEAFASYGPAGDPDGIAGSRAPRTEIQIGSGWRIYKAWCDAEGHHPMPADAQQLLGYVRHLRARNLAPATVLSYVAAVSVVHAMHGHAIDRSAIREPLKAHRRKHGTQRRAKPLLAKMLRDLTERLDSDTSARAVRDRAILLLGFPLAGRSSEIVGLDLERPGSLLTGCTGSIAFEDDGLVVTWLRTKTAQTTETEVFISDREMPSLRPALMRWIEHAGIRPGQPLFRPTLGRCIVRRRLAAEAIRHIVRRRVTAYSIAAGKPRKEALMLANQYSGHSLRRGFCTSASRAKVPFADIRRRSRHRSDTTLTMYIAEAEGRQSRAFTKVGF
jgi:integrase